MKNKNVTIFLLFLICYCDFSYAQTPIIIGEAVNDFGRSVSISGDFCIIGAYESAFIYFKNGNTWEKHTQLKPDDYVEKDWFGYSVSIYNNIALVSSIHDDGQITSYDGKGSVYVFEYIDGVWKQMAKLIADDRLTRDQFGYSLSLYENTAIIGTFLKGVVYIFVRENENEWYLQAKLLPSNTEDKYCFGRSVSIYKDFILIGSPATKSAAYFFVRKNNNWEEICRVTAGDNPNYFAESVSISKNNAIISNFGLYHIYEYNNNTWEQKIILNNKEAFSDGSTNVSMFNNILATANVPMHKNGCVSIYKKNYTWEKFSFIEPLGHNNKGRYGYSLSINESFIVVGAFREQQVYIYPINIESPTISGYVLDSDNKPILNTKIFTQGTFKNESTTDANGFYELRVPHGWNGIIEVDRQPYIFNEAKSYEDIVFDQTNQNFTIDLFSISGFINDITESPISGIEIKFTNDGGSAFTNSKGFFFHKLYHNWSGHAHPIGRGYRFINNDYSNSYYSYNNLSQNKTDQNFSAYKHILFGYVKDQQGNPIPKVTLKLSNIIETAITDVSGYYCIDIDYQWSGKITPQLQNYVFDPLSISYTNVNCDQPNQSFIATKSLPDFFVSQNTLHLTPKSGFALITVTTNDNPSSWSVSNLEIDWVSITKLHHNILISYKGNLNNSERNAALAITHNNTIHNIEIIQAGTVDSHKPPWSVDQSNFRYQAMVTAIIQDKNNNVFDSENDLLAAFVDNECRGVASPLPVSNGKRFFLQVWSNEKDEQIKIKFYDSSIHKIYENVISDIQFSPDLELGDIENPNIFTLKQYDHFPDANNDGNVNIMDAIDVMKFITNTK
ncbi:MAG: hypothetical protein OMM_01116 [Candidatus Magnetoglobus multicellularis str. Araruama]|uniref:Dockerin domain-containing protein n=1 Tax=Candidatus Magnetoglobus multicellularis str. Araruama TaxID=890399 RepID=A0A1V1PEC8_9BACT|nr:MAG: hypothetical protein OMM_01116 [Candidatus Magnetoglobus multicellularis str. Araruama]